MHELTVRAATFGDVPTFRELLSNILRRRGSVRRMGSDASTTATEDTRTRAPLSGPQAAALLRIGMEVQAGPEDPGIADSMPDGNGAPAPGIHPGAPVATRRTATITLAVVGISGFLAMDPGNSPEVAPNGQGAGGSVPASPHSRQEQSMNQVVRIATAGVIGAAATVGAAHAQQAVQWRVEDGGNGHWYQVVVKGGDITWSSARTEALSRGTDLAKLSSSSCMQFVFEVSASTHGAWIPFGNSWLGPWVGGKQLPDAAESSGGWVWIDSTPVDLGQLRSDFNNSDGCGVNEDRMSFWKSSSPPITIATVDFVVSDFPDRGYCEPWYPHEASYVMEWSADCNGDGIVDYGQCHDGTLPDYDSNNIPDCCERGEACAVGNYSVQWRVEEGGNGHWYQATGTRGAITWPSAQAACIAHDGYLATITSDAESSMIRRMVQATNWGQFGPWLGGYQDQSASDYSEPAGGWRWVTGEPWTWTVWEDPTEPNNSFCSPGNESCLHYIGCYGVPMHWNDLPAEGTSNCCGGGVVSSYVIEWSADCNHDNIVDYGQILTNQLADANSNGIPDVCEGPTCASVDLTHNGIVDGSDLGVLLGFWGPRNQVFPQADINGDGVDNGADLGLMLSFWGECPG